MWWWCRLSCCIRCRLATYSGDGADWDAEAVAAWLLREGGWDAEAVADWLNSNDVGAAYVADCLHSSDGADWDAEAVAAWLLHDGSWDPEAMASWMQSSDAGSWDAEE